MRWVKRAGKRLMRRADISRMDSNPNHAHSVPDNRFRDRDHPRMYRFGWQRSRAVAPTGGRLQCSGDPTRGAAPAYDCSTFLVKIEKDR
jgi:hypothetical protein